MHKHSHTTERFKQDILDRITAEQISPSSKLRCQLLYSLFLLASVVAVVFGAVAVAVTIYASINVGWEYYEMTHRNLLTFIVAALPFVWLLVLVLTIGLGYVAVRHTRRGYRYSVGVIVLCVFCGSVGGGVVLYNLKMGAMIDHGIAQAMPTQYHSAFAVQKELWHQPEAGRWYGVISSTTDGMMWLEDIDGTLWDIETVVFNEYDQDLMWLNNEVRLIGERVGETGLVIGCVVLPGMSEMTFSVAEMRERKKLLYERIGMQITKADPVVQASTTADVYRVCHKLLAQMSHKSQ